LDGAPVRRDESAHAREELPWWRRERMKDIAVGFVLGFLSAGVVEWIMKKLGL
jgi:hypothetical protein